MPKVRVRRSLPEPVDGSFSLKVLELDLGTSLPFEPTLNVDSEEGEYESAECSISSLRSASQDLLNCS